MKNRRLMFVFAALFAALAAALVGPQMAAAGGGGSGAPYGPNIIKAGTTLYAGQQVSSENRAYRLRMQGDGNLVIYTSSNRAIWSTRTQGNAGARFVFQRDDNLVVYRGTRALWNSGTVSYSRCVPYLVMQNDGNLVAYDGRDGRAFWSSKSGRLARLPSGGC